MANMLRVLLATYLLAVVAGSRDAQADVDVSTHRALDGSIVTLSAPTQGCLVLVFYSTECPISNYYSAALNALHSEYPISKLRIVGLCVDPDKSTQELIEHAREYRLGFPLVHDSSGCVARRFDVKVTPEVVVLDERSATRYQGRIDDQYQARQKKTAAPTKRDLSDAVARILAGEPVAVGCTEAVGCPLPAIRPARATTYTYARDVAPLLHRHCVECHREGSLAPFALETYEQARKRSGDIASVAADRLMPPWRARPGFGAAFQHDRSLTSAEITMLGTWADAGAPEGDPSELPQLPTFSEGWRLGQPDLVIEMPEEFPVPASGEDIYRCFVVKTDLPNDMYISGIEYRPGNPRVVHHILGYADVTGKAREKDEADSAPGYVCFGGPGVAINNDLGGWAPGAEASVLPEGVGRALPKGSDVIMQVHYHPSGKPERDRSRLGLTFARKPVKQTFHWSFALNDEFEIKPGDADFEVKAERVLPIDVDVHAVAPHMHMLGKDMTMWAELPGGKGRVDLIKIDRWDFKWQRQYMLQQPIRLPRGTTLKVTAHFDNSSDNPSNPSREQPIAVRWGEGTHDEMCIGFIGLVKAGQDLTQAGERDDLRQILDEGEGGSSGRDGRLSR